MVIFYFISYFYTRYANILLNVIVVSLVQKMHFFFRRSKRQSSSRVHHISHPRNIDRKLPIKPYSRHCRLAAHFVHELLQHVPPRRIVFFARLLAPSLLERVGLQRLTGPPLLYNALRASISDLADGELVVHLDVVVDGRQGEILEEDVPSSNDFLAFADFHAA